MNNKNRPYKPHKLLKEIDRLELEIGLLVSTNKELYPYTKRHRNSKWDDSVMAEDCATEMRTNNDTIAFLKEKKKGIYDKVDNFNRRGLLKASF